MTISRLLCAIILLSLSACSPAPLIYKSTDTDVATGSLKPLSDLLPADIPVRLFFIHGVGDHCPGYALDSKNGWLKDENAAAIGLHPLSAMSGLSHINVNVFMGGDKDPHSEVTLATRKFELTVKGRPKKLDVEAIEITWSPLTQWLKSNQLGYDSPSAFADPTSCVEPIDLKIPPTVQAPPRLLINKKIKEQVFDRNLSDAILYSGSYGATMERGLAEGICHAITQTPSDKKCTWPDVKNLEDNRYTNIFVTHSLGSRMTYDVFIDLLNKTRDSGTNPFRETERTAARKTIENMIANTPAVYMMANQLALLGLANVPPNIRSTENVPHPYTRVDFITKDDLANAGERPMSKQLSLENGDLNIPAPPMSITPPKIFGNVLQTIMKLKLDADHTTRESGGLQIVSFNDTNDILTWHIPSWYTNDKVLSGNEPLVGVTDVFVGNSLKLLIFESPTKAHVDYFNNPAVWDVIRCGASRGSLLNCQ